MQVGERHQLRVHLGDAAEAIVRAAERWRRLHDGESVQQGSGAATCYFIGTERLRTSEYYALVEELSGTPRPAREVPAWLNWMGIAEVPQQPTKLLACLRGGEVYMRLIERIHHQPHRCLDASCPHSQYGYKVLGRSDTQC